MAVVVNEFEATAEPAKAGHDEGAGTPREPFAFETRRRLRAVAMRAARIQACG